MIIITRCDYAILVGQKDGFRDFSYCMRKAVPCVPEPQMPTSLPVHPLPTAIPGRHKGGNKNGSVIIIIIVVVVTIIVIIIIIIMIIIIILEVKHGLRW
jgi:hypothetical protein